MFGFISSILLVSKPLNVSQDRFRGKSAGKPNSLMATSMVSCRFSQQNQPKLSLGRWDFGITPGLLVDTQNPLSIPTTPQHVSKHENQLKHQCLSCRYLQITFVQFCIRICLRIA